MNITKYKITIGAIAVNLILALFSFGQTPNVADIRPLPANQTVERELSGGQTHSYSITLKANEFLQVRAEQKGVDVIVKLFDSNKKQLIEMDSLNRTKGFEELLFITKKAGDYEIQISALDVKATTGKYTFQWSGQNATEKDRLSINAKKLYSDGLELLKKPESESEAIAKLKEAVKLYRQIGDLEGEIKCLNWLGLNFTSKDKQVAREYFNQALSIARKLRDKFSEAGLLLNLINTYPPVSEPEKQLEYLNQALLIWHNIGDKNQETYILQQIGFVYSVLGNFQKALEYLNQALSLNRADNSRPAKENVISLLNNISNYYEISGDKQKALEYRNEAALLKNQLGNNTDITLDNFFDLFTKSQEFRNVGNYQKQVEYLKQAESIVQSETNLQLAVFHSLGNAYSNLGENERAFEYFNKALFVARAEKNQNMDAVVLVQIGDLHKKLGDTQKPLDFYNQALLLNRASSEKLNEIYTLSKISEFWFSIGNKQLAVVYGKQAANTNQRFRLNIKELDKETQKNYLKKSEPIYRKLADILIAEGRFPEAQTVLDLLKEEEYKQLSTLRSGETADTVPYNQAEADVVAKIENLVALERERTELQKLLSTNGKLSAEQNNKLAKLNLDIAAANKAFDVALDALGKAEASATTRVDEIKGGKVLQSALTELGEKTNSGVVALYTVLGTGEEKDASGKPIKDKLKSKFGWVIMVTENRYTAYPIDVENLEETVFQFRAALSSDKYNPQPLAEKIYTAIFRQTSPKLKKTLEQDLQDYLKSHKDKTLMWSLDGVLRYIPMAALHDGKQYLVENYQTTVFTKESFIWLMNSYENNWKALGLGVSEKRGSFSKLPGVKTELETIVREPDKQTGILNGSIKLNDNFKKQTFFNIINAGGFPVVHISSHYSFDSGKPENSFLLAGDGNLTFAEIKQQQNLFKKVDLLTLSACDTGVSGNGKEAEGFAYLAQSLGAKSVIASLWKVSDAGTPEMMTRFYQLRKDNPQMSKGEAFRRAQLSLLNGEVKPKDNSSANRTGVIDLGNRKIELPLFVKDEKKLFAHPHYWSSFVLIGNWQ